MDAWGGAEFGDISPAAGISRVPIGPSDGQWRANVVARNRDIWSRPEPRDGAAFTGIYRKPWSSAPNVACGVALMSPAEPRKRMSLSVTSNASSRSAARGLVPLCAAVGAYLFYLFK